MHSPAPSNSSTLTATVTMADAADAALPDDVRAIPRLPQPPTPVCPIAYTCDYTAAMDRLRHVLASGERSARVLALTERAVWLNPAHYSAWQVRRECLAQLDECDVPRELAFCADVLDEHPKNYQVWHHRQAVLMMHDTPEALVSGEVDFLQVALDADAKNFHAWTYRQWLLHTFSAQLWDKELAWTSDMIERDVWNNSVWSQRYFVLHSRPDGVAASDETLQQEVAWTLQQIDRAPSNEASYNYLLGTTRVRPRVLLAVVYTFFRDHIGKAHLSTELEEAQTKQLPLAVSPQFLRSYVELYEDLSADLPDPDTARAHAAWALRMLRVMDAVRVRYWEWVADTLQL